MAKSPRQNAKQRKMNEEKPQHRIMLSGQAADFLKSISPSERGKLLEAIQGLETQTHKGNEVKYEDLTPNERAIIAADDDTIPLEDVLGEIAWEETAGE